MTIPPLAFLSMLSTDASVHLAWAVATASWRSGDAANSVPIDASTAAPVGTSLRHLDKANANVFPAGRESDARLVSEGGTGSNEWRQVEISKAFSFLTWQLSPIELSCVSEDSMLAEVRFFRRFSFSFGDVCCSTSDDHYLKSDIELVSSSSRKIGRFICKLGANYGNLLLRLENIW